MKEPIQFETHHRVQFSQMDPYAHMNTVHYGSYFLEHRMTGLREHLGWDLKTLMSLPFNVFVRSLKIDFLKPLMGDQEFKVTSFVREFVGSDAHIECTMTDSKGRVAATCLMLATCVDKSTMKSMEWPADQISRFYLEE